MAIDEQGIDPEVAEILSTMTPDEIGPSYVEDEEYEPIVSDEEASSILSRWVDNLNIAEDVDEDTLKKIGTQVLEGYKIDKASREDWEEDYKDALKLARLGKEIKSWPWPNAANVKYPLIIQAAIQFNARAFPAIINNGKIVRGRVIGADPDGEKRNRAERTGTHMSYQLSDQMPDWEDEFDTTLLMMPIVGVCFKKTYRDHVYDENVSEYCSVDDVVVNYRVKNLDKASRITHIYELYPNEIETLKRSGAFLKDFNPGEAQLPQDDDEGSVDDLSEDGKPVTEDADMPHTFYEQHRWWDLDDDGYQEPYIITIHESSQQVVRIVARYDVDGITYNDKDEVVRIDPVHIFTAYRFLPSLDGSVYGMGWGILLGHTNESVNATINMLLDAGTNQNTGGGWITKSVKLQRGGGSGDMSFRPGEIKPVEVNGGASLRESIVMRETPQPSITLFKLLETMIESSKLMTSTDLMAGQLPPANTPMGTTQMLLEQSLQVFSGVYKRIFRALGSELKKLARLNRLYMDDEEYFVVTDMVGSVSRDDYNDKDCDVVPEADPNKISDSLEIFKADALMGHKGDPWFKDEEINKNYLEVVGYAHPDRFMNTAEDVAKMTDPEQEAKSREIAVAEDRQKLQREKFEAEKAVIAAGLEETKAKIKKINADAIKSIADAESKEVGAQLDQYKAVVESLGSVNETLVGKLDELNTAFESEVGGGDTGEAGGLRGMDAAPGDIGIPEAVEGAVGGGEGYPV